MNKHKTELMVGVFVVLTVAAVLLLALKVANQTMTSSGDTYQLYAKFDNIGGLKERSAVKVGGVTIGRVTDIHLDKEDYTPVPDGICLDEEGAIWVASPTTNDVIRVKEGGELLERIEVGRGAYACMLGGKEGKTLFISTANDSTEEACLKDRSGRIETIEVSIPRAGLP